MTASSWPRQDPPGGGDRVAQWSLHHATDLAAARRELAEHAARSGLGAEEPVGLPGAPGLAGPPVELSYVDLVALLLSELVTNALRHALPPVDVVVTAGAAGWVLDVADHAPAAPPVLAGDREPGLGGHGLPLVALLARSTGWYVEDGRKHVWAVAAR